MDDYIIRTIKLLRRWGIEYILFEYDIRDIIEIENPREKMKKLIKDKKNELAELFNENYLNSSLDNSLLNLLKEIFIYEVLYLTNRILKDEKTYYINTSESLSLLFIPPYLAIISKDIENPVRRRVIISLKYRFNDPIKTTLPNDIVESIGNREFFIDIPLIIDSHPGNKDVKELFKKYLNELNKRKDLSEPWSLFFWFLIDLKYSESHNTRRGIYIVEYPTQMELLSSENSYTAILYKKNGEQINEERYRVFLHCVGKEKILSIDQNVYIVKPERHTIVIKRILNRGKGIDKLLDLMPYRELVLLVKNDDIKLIAQRLIPEEFLFPKGVDRPDLALIKDREQSCLYLLDLDLLDPIDDIENAESLMDKHSIKSHLENKNLEDYEKDFITRLIYFIGQYAVIPRLLENDISRVKSGDLHTLTDKLVDWYEDIKKPKR